MKTEIKKSKNPLQKVLEFAKSRRKTTIAIIIVLVIGGYFGWQRFASPQNKAVTTTETVQKGTIVSSVSASGQIIGTSRIDINSQATGVVANVYVKNGDAVLAGQKILDITPDAITTQAQSQAWTSYLSATNSLNSANANLFSLQSTMFSKWNTFFNLATNSTYQNSDGSPNTSNRTLPAFTTVNDDWLAAEANYKNQQGVVAQAQSAVTNTWNSYQLVSTTITAPVAGTLDNLNFAQGMVITGSSTSGSATTVRGQVQKVATISTGIVAPVASFTVSETDVTKVKVGQKATITLDAFPGKTFSGTVLTLDKTGTVISGVTSYPLAIQFDVENSDVLPNMSATANIITDSKSDVLIVATSAIQSGGGQSAVRVIKNGKTTSVPVETGLTSDLQTEITSGLSEGDVVVDSISTPTTGQTTGTSPFSGGLRLGGGGLGGGGGARPATTTRGN